MLILITTLIQIQQIREELLHESKRKNIQRN